MSRQAGKAPDLAGAGRRFGIVASRYNGDVVERLLEGAVDALREGGVQEKAIEVVHVPGAFEIPLALDLLARQGRFDGLIAIGAVIRGETRHFEVISDACAHGVAAVSLRRGVPVGFGVLTCDTRQQALARAGGEAGNKGREAAEAALEMVALAAARATDGGPR